MKQLFIASLVSLFAFKSISQSVASKKIVCSEKEVNSKTIKTRTWGIYKSVGTGEFYIGKTYFTYQLYKLRNGKYLKITKNDLFNDSKIGRAHV